MTCPCGSGLDYSGCCEPLHDGAAARTAEALMRSRYSAFALGLEPYLLLSWHPSTRPAALDLAADPRTVWRRLQIVDTVDGGERDETGVVEFRASYRDADGASGVLQERSRFSRVDGDGAGGRWVYLDGVTSQP